MKSNPKQRLILATVLVLLFLPLAAHAEQLYGPAPRTGDYFGASVGIFGDLAVVGAYGDDVNELSFSGAAQLYRYGTDGWAHEAELPTDTVEYKDTANPEWKGMFNANDYLGSAVAVFGNVVVVGAESYDVDAFTNAGAAYVFEKEGNLWHIRGRLTASDRGKEDHFGHAVAIYDNRIVVGAYLDDDNGYDSGAVYVFERPDGGWVSNTETVKLTPGDGARYDYFGKSVATSENFILVGAYGDDDKGDRSGSAYGYRRIGTSWVQMPYKLLADDGADNNRFGVSVAVSDEWAVVGADKAGDYGAAYVFSYSDPNPADGVNELSWVQHTKLTPPVNQFGFGAATALAGGYIAVGANNQNNQVTGNPDFGSSFLYKVEGTAWSYTGNTIGDGYGHALAASGYFAIGGFPTLTSNTGAAFVYQLAPENSLNLPPKIYSIGDQTLRVRDQKKVDFGVFDHETPDMLDPAVTRFQSDVLVQGTDITIAFGGTGTDRTMTISSLTNTVGAAEVDVTITDGDGNSDTTTFTLQINDPPTISAIGDQMINERTVDTDPGLEVVFTISDTETPSTDLTIATASSNLTLLPTYSISVSPTGAAGERLLRAMPVIGKSGKTVITISVRDTHGNTETEAFTLTVNDVPRILDLPGTISTGENTTIAPITFTVSDVESAAVALKVTATSSNEGIATATVSSGSTDNQRILKIVLSQDVVGDATIVVTVTDTDGGVTTEDIFLSVIRDRSPMITFSVDVTQVVMNEGDPSKVIPFTLYDNDTPLASITVLATSSSTTWLPDYHLRVGCSDTGGTTHPCSLTINPPPGNESGSAQITLKADDHDSTTGTASKSFMFKFNKAPVISAIADVNIDEDADYIVQFTISDTETPTTDLRQWLALEVVGGEQLLPTTLSPSCTSGGNCTLMLDPLDNRSGRATIILSLSDGSVTTEESFILNVAPVNDEPEIVNPPDTEQIITEDPAAPLELTFQVKDVDFNNLTLSVTSSNEDLIPNNFKNLDINGFGLNYWIQNLSPEKPSSDIMLSITPAKDANSQLYGPASIELTVSDGVAEVTFMIAQVTVTPVNDIPVITLASPSVTIEEDKETTTPVAVRVSDADGDKLEVTVKSNNAELIAEGMPNLYFVTNNLTTIQVQTQPGQISELGLYIKPIADANGVATLTLSVTEIATGNQPEPTTLEVIVTAVNDAPVISGLKNLYTNEDSQLVTSFFVYDAEMAPEKLGVIPTWGQGVNTSGTGVLKIIGGVEEGKCDINGECTLEITPPSDASGDMLINISVTDGELITPGSFILTVFPVNDAPRFENEFNAEYTTPEDTPATVEVVVSDPETAQLSALKLTATWESLIPADMPLGAITVNGPSDSGLATLTITPPKNAFGEARINVKVTDAEGAYDDASFRLLITGVNDPPTFTPDTAETQQINEDGVLNFVFWVEDVETIADLLDIQFSYPTTETDLDLTFSRTCEPVLNNPYRKKCDLSVRPAANQHGSTTITLTVTDAEGAQDTLTFGLNVVAVNDVPTFELIGETVFPIMMKEDTTRFVYYKATDIETPESVTVNPQWLWYDAGKTSKATINKGENATGKYLEIIPPPDEYGSARVSLTVSDGTSSITPSFEVYIESVNDPPVLTINQADIPTEPVEEDTNVTIAFSVTDIETPDDQLDVNVSGVWGSSPLLSENLIIGGTGPSWNVTLKPLKDQWGTVTLTFTVMDAHGGQDKKDVKIEYTPVNDPPRVVMANPVERVEMEEDASPRTVLFKVSDPDTPVQDLLISASADNAALIPDPISQLYFGTATGTDRTLTIDPPLNANGDAVITVTVMERDDPESTGQITFALRVTPVPDPPTISPLLLENQPVSVVTTDEDTATSGNHVIRVTDPDTNLADLIVGYTWQPISGKNFVEGTVTIGGTGTERNVTLMPAHNDFGEATITLWVKDSLDSNAVKSDPFIFRVTAVNDPPTLNVPIPGPDKAVYAKEYESVMVKFEASDPDSTITVGFSTSDADLLPRANVTLAQLNPPEANLNYQITMKPRSLPIGESSGDVTITIFAQDNHTVPEETSTTFILRVTSDVLEPEISPISKVVMPEDTSKTIQFWVWDAGVSVPDLNVAVTSSDNTVVPDENLTVSLIHKTSYVYKENNYQLTIKPAVNVPVSLPTASTKIIVSVSNGQWSTTREFDVDVTQVNDQPTISLIPNQKVYINNSATVEYTIGDVETAPDDLAINVTSTNQALVPNSDANLVKGGSGANRTLKIVPASGASGQANITVKVTDTSGVAATNSAETTFTFNVGGVAPGDVNADGMVDLNDAVTALQILTGIKPLNYFIDADINNDGKIGFAEALNALQKAAKLR